MPLHIYCTNDLQKSVAVLLGKCVESVDKAFASRLRCVVCGLRMGSVGKVRRNGHFPEGVRFPPPPPFSSAARRKTAWNSPPCAAKRD